MKELLKECVGALESVNGLVVKSEGVDCKFDDLISKLQEEITAKPKSIEDYFNEWETLITELTNKEYELATIKEEYDNEEFEIVYLSDIDFKSLYGSTSEKVRKQHASKELQSLGDAKRDLEIDIARMKRRLAYLKGLMTMQGNLIQAGVLE